MKISSHETRDYKFCLQTWTYFLLLDKQDIAMHTLIQKVSYFSCYAPRLISWSQMWQLGGGHFQQTFLYKDMERGSASAPSSGELSDSASSVSHNKLSASLSGVPSESSSIKVTLCCGCRAFTWQGIPSTKKDCGLITSVIQPLPNFVVHRFCGVSNYTQSGTRRHYRGIDSFYSHLIMWALGNGGHHSVWCPFLTSASYHLPPVFLFSMDWHSSHVHMANLTAAFVVAGKIFLTK